MLLVYVFLLVSLPFILGDCPTPTLKVPLMEDLVISTNYKGRFVYVIENVTVDFGDDVNCSKGFVRVDMRSMQMQGFFQFDLNVVQRIQVPWQMTDLNKLKLPKIIFLCEENDEWSCKFADFPTNITTFIVPKQDLQAIFVNSTFMPYSSHVHDHDLIYISIYDGVDGPCLSQSQYEYFNNGALPLKTHCTKTTAVIITPNMVDENEVEFNEDSSHSTLWDFLSKNRFSIGMGLLGSIGVVMGCIGIVVWHQTGHCKSLLVTRGQDNGETRHPEQPVVNESGVIGPFETQEERDAMLAWANETFGTDISH